MSKRNIYPPAKNTALSSFEPMTDTEWNEVCKKDLETWLGRTLKQLIHHAYLNDDFAKKLCEETSKLTRYNRELVKIIKRHAISVPGRHPPAPKSSNFYFMLIHHYAHYFNESESETYQEKSKAAINCLISDYERWTGSKLKHETMRNKLGEAIKSEDISTYADYAQDAINQRIEHRLPRK